MKVADVKLTWTKSVSSDVTKVVVNVTIDGNTTTTEVGSEIQELMVEVAANKSASFTVDTYNADGKTSSAIYSFTLDSLELPQAATNLSHTIVSIRDVTDPTPPSP